MGTVVALGASHALDGFGLVGVHVVHASHPDEVRAAWRALPDDVGLVILSHDAEAVLHDALDDRPDVLTAVLP